MNILIIGHVCIDRNVTEHASYTGAGSPAMFMQKIFRQIPDTTVQIAAPYGADFLDLSAGTLLIPAVPGVEKTMVYENTILHGKRTQRCHYAELAVPPVPDEQFVQAIRSADIICIAPLAPNFSPGYLRTVTGQKQKNAIIVLLPQGYFRHIDEDNRVQVREFSEAPDILPLVNVVIVSDQDHTGMDTLAGQWATQYGTLTVMTRAENGADIFSGENRINVPTSPVRAEDIVSSVGAGDIFSAGFMYAYNKTHNPVKAAGFGHALARQCLFVTPDAITIRIP